MRFVETIPGMGGRRIKESDEGDKLNYMIYCKSFCKCHNVLPLQNNMIKNIKQKYPKTIRKIHPVGIFMIYIVYIHTHKYTYI
jgi:hypothetical protein